MTRIGKLSAAAIVMLALSPWAAQADGLYGGVKLGLMLPSISGFDNATNGGLVLGYATSRNAAIEGEITTSVADGDANVPMPGGKWDLNTYALYGAYRFGGDLYGKAKLGVVYEDPSDSGSLLEADSGLSVGVGGGYLLSRRTCVELEYTVVDQDVNFLSLGVNFAF